MSMIGVIEASLLHCTFVQFMVKIEMVPLASVKFQFCLLLIGNSAIDSMATSYCIVVIFAYISVKETTL